MAATIIISICIAALFVLAVRHIIRQHKEGGCCGSCKGCHGCDHLSCEEIKAEQSEQ